MSRGYRPKHLATPRYCDWRRTVCGRALNTATAAIMAGLLTLPGTALAASSVGVEDVWYDQAASGSGSNGGSWSWNGADDMVLNNYDGGAISAEGNLVITLVGDNSIDVSSETSSSQSNDGAISVKSTVESQYGSFRTVTDDDNLTLTGDGSVTANVEGSDYAITANNITVDRATVSVQARNDGSVTGLLSRGSTSIREGSQVDVEAEGDYVVYGMDVQDQLSVSDSSLSVIGNGGSLAVGRGGEYGSRGVMARGTVSITDSVVDLNGTYYGLTADNGITLTNSDISAVAQTNGEDNGEILARWLLGDDGGYGLLARTGGITVESMTGVSVKDLPMVTGASDEANVPQVLTSEEGDTLEVLGVHTGAPSKYAAGVQDVVDSSEVTDGEATTETPKEPEQTEPETTTEPESTENGSIAELQNVIATPEPLAVTGGIVAKASAAIPQTDDPTNPLVTFLAGCLGTLLAFVGAKRRVLE